MTINNVQQISLQITQLLQRSGTIFPNGAHGVFVIGSLLSRGSFFSCGCLENEVKDTIQDEKDKTTNSSKDNQNNIMPITDTLLSQLTSSFVLSQSNNTSSARVKAFISSLVLPVVQELRPPPPLPHHDDGAPSKAAATRKQKCPPASRILQTTIFDLVKDRPEECVDSLLLPILLDTTTTITTHDCHNNHKVIKSDVSKLQPSLYEEPSQPQCDLITKVIKSSSMIPLDCIPHFVSGLVCGIHTNSSVNENNTSTNDTTTTTTLTTTAKKYMIWTDVTLPILTACFNRKPILSVDVIISLCYEIERYVSYSKTTAAIATVTKSVKFSAMFHAFVTKYGAQIKGLSRGDSDGGGGTNDGRGSSNSGGVGGDVDGSRLISILQESAKQLKIFMGKTILSVLKKL